jgi:formylglycine-generating enzyme required for sulfatase activity
VFRLPTEAQREYACRAGTTTATAFGDKLSSKQAKFRGRSYNGSEKGPSLNRATKAGSLRANAWGLHDMQGNLCE